MAASEAQIAANRRNSQLSTGPRSEAGKARSRRNALKHGLTGDGVALCDEDEAEVTSRFRQIEAEMQPSGTASRLLLRRFTYLSVRLERCERLDTGIYSKRIRHAEEEFLDHRMTRVEELASMLDHEPMTATRRLQTMPEGIDYLIRQWSDLRLELMNRERAAWTLNHWSRMERLLGIPEGNYRNTRLHALTQGLSGYFIHINPSEIEGLSDLERVEWARGELAKTIDVEVARLEAVKVGLDPSIVEQDRLEAADRCLFDPQPAMNLVRKYEAATERGMYKALKEFREVEATLKANGVEPESEENPGELASFEPETQADEIDTPAEPRYVPKPPPIPETIHFSKIRSLDDAPKGAHHPEIAFG